MASDEQRLLGCSPQRGPAISRGIVVVLYRQALDLGLKPFASFEPRFRPRDALRSIVVGGQRAQFL